MFVFLSLSLSHSHTHTHTYTPHTHACMHIHTHFKTFLNFIQQCLQEVNLTVTSLNISFEIKEEQILNRLAFKEQKTITGDSVLRTIRSDKATQRQCCISTTTSTTSVVTWQHDSNAVFQVLSEQYITSMPKFFPFRFHLYLLSLSALSLCVCM